MASSHTRMNILCEFHKIIPLARADHPILTAGLNHWRTLRGSRRYPGRSQLTLRSLGRLAHNIILLRRLDNGDFEARIAGDGALMPGQSLPVGTTFGTFSDEMAAQKDIRIDLFRAVASRGEPLAYNGFYTADHGVCELVEAIILALPLGPDDNTVDFLYLIVTHRPVSAKAGVASLPPKTDPIWRALATGKKDAKWNALATRVLMTHVRNEISISPSEDAINAGIDEIFEYFVTNVLSCRDDIAAVFS